MLQCLRLDFVIGFKFIVIIIYIFIIFYFGGWVLDKLFNVGVVFSYFGLELFGII